MVDYMIITLYFNTISNNKNTLIITHIYSTKSYFYFIEISFTVDLTIDMAQ